MSEAKEPQACASCGRRHGTRVLVASLQPLVFGRPQAVWVWFDPDSKPSGCWRDRNGFLSVAPAEGLPRQAEEVRLWRITDGYETFHACDRCKPLYSELTWYRTELLETQVQEAVVAEQKSLPF
jgi:hypothetical protein